MPETTQNNEEPIGPSERIEKYRREVQSLVEQGGEQAQFEFKRSLSLNRENLDDRLDFIKLIQSLANAHINGERCIVVGADPREKKFFPVVNPAELDAANVSKILAAYLDPLPRFEVFHVATDSGQAFALFVLHANQLRPIVVIKQGHTQAGKSRLEVGDIWIKRNTDTVRALPRDLDSMYGVKIEEEAENRARQRFKHFMEISGAFPQSLSSGTRPLPIRGLLVEPESQLRRFAEEVISDKDSQRFLMLLELARESLVEGWESLDARRLPADIKQFASEVTDFFKNEFLPVLQSVVTLGLLIIKYDFKEQWSSAIGDLLTEAFDVYSKIVIRMKLGYAIEDVDVLPGWRPALEIYIGIRTIATYAIKRNRLRFLGSILPKFVRPVRLDELSRVLKPIAFWPLPNAVLTGHDILNGRAAILWKERIAAAWRNYFAGFESFLSPSFQLEFLLELNSYLGVNALKDAKIAKWLATNGAGKVFAYMPDLYSHDLQRATPMAELIYDALSESDSFPSDFVVEQQLFDLAFKGKSREERLLIYGGFLNQVEVSQDQFRWQHFQRTSFLFEWEGRLRELVDSYKKNQSHRG